MTILKNAIFIFKAYAHSAIMLLLILFCLSCAEQPKVVEQEEWVALFNGANYDDWTPKFAGYKLGVNHNNRFVYKDSLLSVRYAKTDTFNGNLLYPNQYYVLLHCQEPATLGLDQDFPISLEYQLLGGDGTHERTTANLCTPGTNVVMNDSLFTPHCVNSTSKTYHGDQWVTAEALVLGDSLVQHIMEKEVVLEFKSPTIGGGGISGYKESAYVEGKPLKEGYISIQAETHPIDFKNIEVLNLCGCMDEKAKNYKSYYVKADNTTCIYE